MSNGVSASFMKNTPDVDCVRLLCDVAAGALFSGRAFTLVSTPRQAYIIFTHMTWYMAIFAGCAHHSIIGCGQL